MLGSKISLLLLSLVIAISLPSWAQNLSSNTLKKDQITKVPKYQGEWNLVVGGMSTEEGKDEGAAAVLWFDSKFNLNFHKTFGLFIRPRVSLYSSRLQERLDSDEFSDEIWLMDGYARLTPIEYLEFRGGTLNQGYHGTSMLVSGYRSFPGLQEIVQYKTKDFTGKIVVQQAVPTSHSLNDERQREEKLPMFNTESLILTGKNFAWLEWEATGGHFKWSNLPSKVAWDSRLVGASVTGSDNADSSFDYKHEGWFTNLEGCVCANSLVGFVGEFERLRNTKAPEKAADAQMIGGGPKFRFGAHEIDLRYRSFFIESDATVAKYGKGKFGYTNRIGDMVEATWHLKDLGFTVFAEAYRANTINRSDFQRDLRIYYLGVETDYASFF